MAKKNQYQEFSNLIGSIKKSVNDSCQSQMAKKIPDIISFVNDEEWLGLPTHSSNPINLYQVQALTLKCFYRGSLGNENIDLTEQEKNLLLNLKLDSDDKGNVLEKFYNGELFKELVLVWGRRAGKDFLVSIIALYEAMKLIECPGGDPYRMYELSDANSINVLTVANSSEQSKLAYTEMRSKLLNSKYFEDKFIKDGFTSNSIYLLTPKDKEDNIDRKKKGLPLKKGSIGLIVGHSNSDSLLGMGCIVLICDEVATYKNADKIYQALVPTVSTYSRKIYEYDEDGNVGIDEFGQKKVKKIIYDGKIISISSPRGKEGKFHEMYKNSPMVPNRLCMRLPTWEVTPQTRDSLRKEYSSMSEAEFNMEFGAEFSGIGIENMFSEDQVNSCFIGHKYNFVDRGSPKNIYFGHVDPATSSHNYAVVIVHKEFFLDQKTKKVDYFIVVDFVKKWSPLNGKPIDVIKVCDYIVGLKRQFRIGMLTYDQWQSTESIIKLRNASIPNKLTRFNRPYKMLIYKELENLINSNKLKVPYHDFLRQEMIDLQRKFDQYGFRVSRREDGDGVKSDDLSDCLAGACYTAVQEKEHRLPYARTVGLGNPRSNMIPWRNMQGGVYGYGTGQQVSQMLEKRNSWPNYRR